MSQSRRNFLSWSAVAVLAFLLAVATPAFGADASAAKKKVLYLTQSVGFRHQPVTRKAPDQLASSELAKDLGSARTAYS